MANDGIADGATLTKGRTITKGTGQSRPTQYAAEEEMNQRKTWTKEKGQHALAFESGAQERTRTSTELPAST
ncbi:protein of unknown function [Paraburkholderia kururiensis]